ncbi:hypothetical protein HMPREF9004_0310 [Schaalia cardiffensis F0333]|uniref:Glycosyltransferase RgtA/B/C/D-like domain-containing protein n=2 Tax=Schaalia TaxID=2529408 RepID=N6W8T8_9ACTO|nr:hypothetical protein HMPREF9004_0310 [Schaalia cardiffensis F0333]
MSHFYSRLDGFFQNSRKSWAGLAVFYSVIASALTLPFMKLHRALSVYDEFQYIDAVDKARRWDVVLSGDKTDQYARILAACRGAGLVPEYTIYQGPCASSVADTDTFIQGYTSADIHSPLYFFVTAWLSWPLQRLAGLELLTAARLTGIIWLALGMLVLAWALHRLGAHSAVVIALPIAVASMPVFRVTNSYVTPDALNLLAGSLILTSAFLYARGESSPWIFIAASSLFSIVKLQNVFAVVAALLFLFWRAGASWRSRRAGERMHPGMPDLALMTIIPFLAALSWLVIRRLTGVIVDRPALDGPANYTIKSLFTTIDDAVKIIFQGNGGWGISTPESFFVSLLTWGLFAALIATAFFDVEASMDERVFARAGLVSLLAIGPMSIAVFALVFHAHIDVLSRYVMVLVPLLCLPAAKRFTRHGSPALVCVFAFAAFAYAVLLRTVN